MEQRYISLDKLEVYVLSLKLGRVVWQIYQTLDWQLKKITGDQFIESTDSVGANIAEGYGRYHYLDKVKFYYNSRGSLLESRHWFGVLYIRGFIAEDHKKTYLANYKNLRPKLNQFIKNTAQQKN